MTLELVEVKLPGMSNTYFIKMNGVGLEGSETPYLDQANKLYDSILAEPQSVTETIIRSLTI